MSQDRFTTTTRTSWFQRVGSALGGILFGLALVAVGVGLLAWNEARSVTAIRTADDSGRRVAVASPDSLEPALDGRLVHVTGSAVAPAPPSDPDTGFEAQGLRLVRTVEHFQWIETSRSETRTRLGGGQETVTTYDYATGWSPRPVQSDAFQRPEGHRNPEPSLLNADYPAPSLMLGRRTLSAEAAARLPASSAAAPTTADAERAAARLGRRITTAGDALYVGQDFARPRVGDARIRYSLAPAGVISVMARQDGERLTPFQGPHGQVFEVRPGALDSAAMVRQVKAENQVVTWLLRLAGFLAVTVGVGLMLHPARVLADVIPLAGAIVGFGVGLASFACGVALTSLVIAVAWFAVRPMISLGLIVLGLGTLAAILRLRRRPKAQRLLAA